MLEQVKISVAMLDNMLRFGDLAFDVAQFETGQPQNFQAPPALPAFELPNPIVGSQSLRSLACSGP